MIEKMKNVQCWITVWNVYKVLSRWRVSRSWWIFRPVCATTRKGSHMDKRMMSSSTESEEPTPKEVLVCVSHGSTRLVRLFFFHVDYHILKATRPSREPITQGYWFAFEEHPDMILYALSLIITHLTLNQLYIYYIYNFNDISCTLIIFFLSSRENFIIMWNTYSIVCNFQNISESFDLNSCMKCCIFPRYSFRRCEYLMNSFIINKPDCIKYRIWIWFSHTNIIANYYRELPFNPWVYWLRRKYDVILANNLPYLFSSPNADRRRLCSSSSFYVAYSSRL